MKPRWVYFIRPKGMLGPIKIGCSQVPEDRLAAIMTWSPWRLEIFGRVPGSSTDEAFLHKCFADLHSHHEWFRAEPRLYAAINKIIAANNVDAVRSELCPVGKIRIGTRLEWTPERKLRASYRSRINRIERSRRAAEEERWHAPNDVVDIMEKWDGYGKYYPYGVRQQPITPSVSEMLRLDQFLAEPEVHSVVPYWEIKAFASPPSASVGLEAE